MSEDNKPPTAHVVDYYDGHPISEQQILDKLAAAGWDGSAPLTEDILQAHDQDHFGGVAAVDALAAAAGIGPGSHVLDVCSGLGGPARYLAHNYGCTIQGIDFTESRVRGAAALTHRVNLDDRVRFRRANALANPFADGTFDVVIGQEAWCHIPEKASLVGECVRVLKRSGIIAFTDIVRTAATSPQTLARLQQEMRFFELATAEEYRNLIRDNGCDILAAEDLSQDWARILIDRLAMYRGLRDQTIGRFGTAHYQRWDAAYAHFVDQFQRATLGGCRIVARRR